jgi:mannose-1-phosphate guanylyltransferase/mannose-6-phosphate isomerase
MAHLRMKSLDAVLAVVTSDHVIPDVAAFREGVARAVAWAQNYPAIVLLGVNPTKQPADWKGFGCFKMGKLQGGPAAKARAIEAFEEKPSLDRAGACIKEGGWVWNAGMFFFALATAERALERYQPAMSRQYLELCDAVRRGQTSRAKAIYKEFPAKIPHPLDPSREVDNTIDYAIVAPLVQKPSEEGAAYAVANALPAWADVGEWTALRSLVKPDRKGNVRLGKTTVDAKTSNCILAADRGCQIDAHGLKDTLVAVADGTALILPLKDVPNMKAIVSSLDPKSSDRALAIQAEGCRISARGGRVIVHGRPNLDVRFAKNRLRVSLLPSMAVL